MVFWLAVRVGLTRIAGVPIVDSIFVAAAVVLYSAGVTTPKPKRKVKIMHTNMFQFQSTH